MSSFNMDSYYKYRYFTAKPDPEMQKRAAKLPNELVGRIFQYRFPDALKKLQMAEMALNRKSPGVKLSHQELIAYNDALDDFQLVTRQANTGLSEQAKADILADAMRLNHPRIYKILTNNVFGVRSDLANGEFGQALHLKDKQQFSLLSKAILTRRYGEAHKLLDKNLDATSEDAAGNCPIEWASLMGHPSLVKRMIRMTDKNKLLPLEANWLESFAAEEDSELSDNNRQLLRKTAQKEKLNRQDCKNLNRIAPQVYNPAMLRMIANRGIWDTLLNQAENQKALKGHLLRRRDDRYFDFENIDLEDADEFSEDVEIENVFRRGMAGLAAGIDMHPNKEYLDWSEMSHFGQLVERYENGAHPKILSAIHALLQSGIDVNQNASEMSTPLRLINPYTKMLDLLLDAGADPNKLPDKGDESILNHFWFHYPETKNDTELTKKLINAGADPNIISSRGITPLLVAAGENSPDMALLLLENGADPNLGEYFLAGAPTEDKDKSLHTAAKKNHNRLLQAMIDKGAHINVQNGRHRTPLHTAVQEGYGKSVKVLMKNGADPHIPDDRNVTPTKIAESKLNQSIVSFAEMMVKNATFNTDRLLSVINRQQILQALQSNRKKMQLKQQPVQNYQTKLLNGY